MENPTDTTPDQPTEHAEHADPRMRGRWLRMLDRLDAYKRVTETISDEDLATTRRTLETLAREFGDERLAGGRGHRRGHRGFGPGHRGLDRGQGCDHHADHHAAHHRGERGQGFGPHPHARRHGAF